MGRRKLPAEKSGLFGAPRCRLTGALVALSAVLTGLVFAGVGAAVAGFQWHESFPRIMGLLCIVVGGVLMLVGGGMFIVDGRRRQPHVLISEEYSYEATNQAASTATTTPDSRTPKNGSSGTLASKDAPPPYDALNASGFNEASSITAAYAQQQQKQCAQQQTGSRQPTVSGNVRI